ncbi:MAG: OB-fold domain-containing protein, partial [Zhenhengia sp.]
MIAYLIGEITDIEDNNIYIEVNGVGYEVFMPYDHDGQMLRVGTKMKAYIYEHIK